MNINGLISNGWRTFKKEGASGVAHSLFRRASVHYYEWRYGIDTDKIIFPKELGIENDECHSVQRHGLHQFFEVLGGLDIRDGRDTFLDYGAGLGRVVILAARFPFKRVLGVEISPRLAAAAAVNCERARPRLCCRNIELTCQDARLYEVPSDVTVIFFFNTFRGTLLARVLENIQDSLRDFPRGLTVGCNLPPRSQFETQIRNCSWLEVSKIISLGLTRVGSFYAASKRRPKSQPRIMTLCVGDE